MDRWITVAQVLAGPVLAILVKSAAGFGRFRRQRHQIRENVGLLESLPAQLKPAVEGLLVVQVEALVRDQTKLLSRKLDGATVGTLVLVGLVGGGAVAAGLAIDRWWSIAFGSVIASFCLVLCLVGLGQLYKYAESEPSGNKSTE